MSWLAEFAHHEVSVSVPTVQRVPMHAAFRPPGTAGTILRRGSQENISTHAYAGARKALDAWLSLRQVRVTKRHRLNRLPLGRQCTAPGLQCGAPAPLPASQRSPCHRQQQEKRKIDTGADANVPVAFPIRTPQYNLYARRRWPALVGRLSCTCVCPRWFRALAPACVCPSHYY